MSTKYAAPTSKVAPAAAAAADNSNGVADVTKVKICTGHTRPVCHINYSEIVDGTFWFVTSCHDAKPMIRNGQTGNWVGTFEGHKGAVYCSAFNGGATRLVTGSGDYSAMVWDAVTGQKLHTWIHPKYIKSCDWRDNKICTGCFDGTVRIYDANKLDGEPAMFEVPKTGDLKATYFIDNHTMVTACGDVISKWDLRDTSAPYISKEIKGLNILEYTHKHSLVAAHEKSITFIDTGRLEIKSSFNTGDDVECASLSPNGQNVAAGSKLKTKEFTIDGTELESNRGHHGPVFHVRWAPDGNSYTSGAEDGMVRVWPSHDIIEKYENEN
ncbi:serine-threonine kinase receptor-associated protein [Strigomonas culicis]|uniref:Serine-threonine kinase receptor-associated protein n=1 Tax=Strigomonas culicis TaxID=28005 RepID=S9TU46_9TRYP|nr:serine-threonine kinase receptor-associated protein [Strigomonas culicis]EPY24824.1 serine-threonine kinase receptor-associated protein [Strigomonas culicis]EPY30247.1 serine-threonine kinase receptor-associated protein [Strigomonas culicis]EPY36411.1 serine-threonine kinase receptor-associated protein [Strigomonas culicis]|eukprot:EPY20048.1 serine-threonine kinase receptor-associated protein [Strigomonas culicis]